MLGERKERKLREKRNESTGITRPARSAPSAFSAGTVLHSLQTVLRRIVGMPDYERHIEHLRHCHPERPLPSEREYYENFVRARYEDGPTRCC